MNQPTQTRKPFIVVDGPDGAGKTTLIKGLTERYLKHEIPCLPFRNPAGTPIGAAIRKASIEIKEGEEPSSLTRLLCQVAACHELVVKKLEPNIGNSIVIFDRYLLSTVVYQGLMTGIYMPAFCERFTQLTKHLPVPEMTIVLQATREKLIERTGVRRTAVKKKTSNRGFRSRKALQEVATNYEKDVMESEHRLAMQAYAFAQPGSWLPPNANYMAIDTSERTEAEVLEEVWSRLCKVWRVDQPEAEKPNLAAAREALKALG